MTPKETKPVGFLTGHTLDIPARGLTKDICKKYGYQVATYNGETCHVANYRDLEGELVAQKLRFKDKRFQCKGAPNVFFGQHLWPNGCLLYTSDAADE